MENWLFRENKTSAFAIGIHHLLASRGRPLHRLLRLVSIDLPVRPVVPGLARSCPALRVKPTRFQAYSSCAGTLEGSRLAKHKLPQTTTTTTTTTTTSIVYASRIPPTPLNVENRWKYHCTNPGNLERS